MTIPYTYQEASYPGDTFTQLLGINKSGVIAGYHGEDPNKGFTLILPHSFTDENYPNSAGTQVIAINNAGDTAGFYVDAAGMVSGFTRIKGAFAIANAPATQFNQILGLNNVGELAGYSSTDPEGETLQRAFVRQANGSYTYLAMPDGTTNSQATAINDSHMVVGFYVDADDNNHGFIWSNGKLSTLDYPGSAFTQALGVNNWGQVVGQFQDGFGGTHGFVYTNGNFQSVDEPDSAPGTTLVNGINDLGQIVGFYMDADDNTIGFVGTPQASSETAVFRALLTPSAGFQASGTADVIAHLVYDGTGQIVSGTVDFWARPNFIAGGSVTGLSILSGSPTGTAVINSNVTIFAARTVKAGGDLIKAPAQIKGDSPAALAALRELMDEPGDYYVNLMTPTGSMTGQLQAAQWVVLMGMMDPNNETPPASNSKATGIAQAIAIGTRGSNGNWTSGEVLLTTTYTNQKDPAPFTGFHIHLGQPGAAGPVVIPAALPAGIGPDASGSGVVGPIQTEIALTNAQQVAAFTDLFTNPGATYMNIHNSTYPGGFMRAQLRMTDSMTFPFVLDSANEPFKPGVNATGPGSLTLYTLRREDGSVAAATAAFDVNYRLPGAGSIMGLGMYDGGMTDSALNPSIWIVPTVADPAFNTDTGFGAFFDWTPPIAGNASLNDAVMNPEKHYVNLITLSDAKGAMRSQLAPPPGTGAMIQAATSSNMDANATTVAPGELVSIFGANLSKVETSLNGWAGRTLPTSLNGATVTIGGQHAPLLYVSGEQINAQVPLNVPPGKQPVVVNNGSGPSDVFTITVADAAPAIFYDPMAAVVKARDYSLVTDENPAHAGDTILVYWTGGGQTSPPMSTGVLVSQDILAYTTPVTVTLGDRSVPVMYSVASPNFVGLYQTALTIPNGLTGSLPLTLKLGGATSNVVNISVQ